MKNHLEGNAIEKHFITCTSYEGSWDFTRACMHGFGCYVFGDNSTYRGYFQDGKFHGFGCIQLEPPFKFQLKGFFENGHLIEIEDMIFSDGLHATARPKDKNLDFSNWEYCTGDDRRYRREIAQGLKAFSPLMPIAQASISNDLTPGHYDTEEGIYKMKTGFIVDRPEPYAPLRFISCSSESNYIKENYRGGRQENEVIEPAAHFCYRIIKTNIDCQQSCNIKARDQCSDKQKKGHKYFSKLYDIEMAEARKTLRGFSSMASREKYGNMAPVGQDSVMTCLSFPDAQLKETEMIKKICEKPKCVCSREGSISINLSALERKKLFHESVPSVMIPDIKRIVIQ